MNYQCNHISWDDTNGRNKQCKTWIKTPSKEQWGNSPSLNRCSLPNYAANGFQRATNRQAQQQRSTGGCIHCQASRWNTKSSRLDIPKFGSNNKKKPANRKRSSGELDGKDYPSHFAARDEDNEDDDDSPIAEAAPEEEESMNGSNHDRPQQQQITIQL